MSKKLFTLLFFIFLSTETFSEEYICSYIFKDEISTQIFERKENMFIRKDENSKYMDDHILLRETEKVIYLLGESISETQSMFTIIHKETLQYQYSWIRLGIEDVTEIDGKCVVVN